MDNKENQKQHHLGNQEKAATLQKKLLNLDNKKLEKTNEFSFSRHIRI